VIVDPSQDGVAGQLVPLSGTRKFSRQRRRRFADDGYLSVPGACHPIRTTSPSPNRVRWAAA
jgi:hypothetical protein